MSHIQSAYIFSEKKLKWKIKIFWNHLFSIFPQAFQWAISNKVFSGFQFLGSPEDRVCFCSLHICFMWLLCAHAPLHILETCKHLYIYHATTAPTFCTTLAIFTTITTITKRRKKHEACTRLTFKDHIKLYRSVVVADRFCCRELQ